MTIAQSVKIGVEDRDDKVIYVMETFFDITNQDQNGNESG